MESDNQEEEMTFAPNQVCIATDHFDGQEDEDLKFSAGERITILRPTEVMFWYIAKNERGDVGTVPTTHLTPVTNAPEDAPPPVPPKPTSLSRISPDLLPPKPTSLSRISPDPLPPKPTSLSRISQDDPEDYQKMGPGGAVSQVKAGKTKSKSKPKPLTDEEKEIMRIMEREKQRRYAKGTLVVATATFRAEKFQDMAFKVHEEMILLEPMQDYCWYYAQKVENPSKKGVIPITHVRLVYMSDDEDEDEGFYKPTNPGHERLYDDRNDFITRSGWFSFTGLALGKEAQLNVLARKAKMNYEDFMAITKAVYMLSYRQEKVFVGKADILSEELMKHFDNFGKTRKQICEIDDELCHHTEASGWDLKVWPIGPEQNLELEWTKKIIENDSLSSSDGAGVNEYMSFTSMETFNTFWEWLSPN